MTFLNANSVVQISIICSKSYRENNKPVNIAQVLILKLCYKMKCFFFKKIHVPSLYFYHSGNCRHIIANLT